MADIIEPIPNPATHRRLRWHAIQIENGESYKGLRASAQWVPVSAANDRVPGPAERDASRDVSLVFDPQNPQHMQAYLLLDAICREADAQAQAAGGANGGAE
jgi:hypothetical protein